LDGARVSQEGVVTKELFAVDLPFLPKVIFFPESLPPRQEQTGKGFRRSDTSGTSPPLYGLRENRTHPETAVKVAVTTFETWQSLANRLNEKLIPREDAVRSLYPKAKDLTQNCQKPANDSCFLRFRVKEDKNSHLPLGSTGFQLERRKRFWLSGTARGR